MSRRNSSRLWTLSAVVSPPSDRWMSIESIPTACARRRWLSERLRAIRTSPGGPLWSPPPRPPGRRAGGGVGGGRVGGDPGQPRAHVDVALVGQHRVERRREDLLQHV